MSTQLKHPSLANGRWNEFSFMEQMANVGSEVIRCIKWKPKNEKLAMEAAGRALELLYLTKGDPKNKRRLRELCRLYEVLVNDLYGFKDYKPNLPGLEKYFVAFTFAAAEERRIKRVS